MRSENQKTILLVEDEAITAMAEKMTLEKYGYKIIAVKTGEEAVAAVAKTPAIDLVLMDINLGAGIDGAEAAAIILRERDLPVVFLSSHTEPEVVEKTEKITSYGYVVKNSSITVLDASIKMAFKLFEAKIKEQEKEKALRESEASYRVLFSGASDGILLADSQTKQFRYANPAICRMMGYTEEEFLRINVADIHPKDSLDHVLAEFAALERGEIRSSPDLPCLRKDGTIFYADISHSAMVLEGHEYHAGFFHDITKRKQAEEAVFQSKKDWEDCFDTITDMITIHDNDYNIVRANKAGKALLKLPALEKHLQTKCFSFYHGTDAPPAGCPSCDCLKSGMPGVFESFEPYLNRYLEIRAIPRFDSHNQRAGLIHIVRDITERKRVEELLAIQARIAAVFLMMPDDEMFNEVLKIVLEVMHSPFGVFGYLDENGNWVVPTLTQQVWDKRQIPDKMVQFPRETWEGGIWACAVREKRTILSNEPSTNIPAGPVGIQRHISMPVLFKGEVIGLFLVANKVTDYTEGDIRTLTEITGYIAPLLSARLMRERAQETLRVNDKKLKEAQVLGQIGNWEYDVKNQKITWSNQVYKLYERDPVLGPPTIEEEAAYYSPEQGQTLRRYIRIAIETGQFFEYDLQATLPSGKQVYLAARLRPIKDAQGRVIKLFGIVQDITERKQAESQREAALESLRESESRIKSISNNFTAGMIYQVVINPDGNRKFTYLSDSVQQLYGISPEEGMADATLIYSRVHEDDLELLTKDEDEAVKTFSTFKTDARMKDPSGKIRWSSFVSTPKMMADGSICFDGVEFIITKRKLAEEALTKSEEKFRKAFNTSPDSVAITRLEDGMYISINPGFTKITGYTEEDIFGKTSIGDNIWNNIEDRQRLVAGLKKHGEVTNLEAAFRMKDGNIRYGLMSASIIDLAGVPHFLSITRDITERKRAEERLASHYALLQAIINSPGDIIVFSLDTQYCYTAFNDKHRREMKKVWNADVEIGMNMLDCMNIPEFRALAKGSMDRSLFGESFLEEQYQSNLDIYYEFTWNPVMQGKDVVGVAVFTRDITERKRVEEQIKSQLEELKRWHNVTLDRENRILDLKREVNELLGKAGQPPRYPSAESQNKKEK